MVNVKKFVSIQLFWRANFYNIKFILGIFKTPSSYHSQLLNDVTSEKWHVNFYYVLFINKDNLNK